jgi:PBP1b-binding outer membrane lipoprotein LpoB
MKKYICLFGIALFAYSCSVEPFEQQDDNNLQNEIESYTSQTKSILRIDNSLFIMKMEYVMP